MQRVLTGSIQPHGVCLHTFNPKVTPVPVIRAAEVIDRRSFQKPGRVGEDERLID